MNDLWNQLTKADPSHSGFNPAPGLLDQIRSLPTDPAPSRRRVRRWVTRGSAVIIAALLLGGAVSWATGVSMIDQVERIWGLDRNAGLSADRSGYGLDQFAVMEPMTGERMEELPETLKHWLLMPRVYPRPVPAGPLPENWPNGPRMLQKPGRIAGWGTTFTPAGDRADVISMNGQVCLIFDRFHGGNCGTVEEVERTGIATTMRQEESPEFGFQGTMGLVPDEVVSLRIDYPGYGEVPIQDNVFHATDIPDDRFFIVGRDANGEVRTRVFVSKPITPAQRRFMQRAPHRSDNERE